MGGENAKQEIGQSSGSSVGDEEEEEEEIVVVEEDHRSSQHHNSSTVRQLHVSIVGVGQTLFEVARSETAQWFIGDAFYEGLYCIM